MRTETGKASVKSAYGEELTDEQGLPREIKFTYQYDVLSVKDTEQLERIKKAFKDSDYIRVANAAAKAKARASAQTEALKAAGIEPPAKDSPRVVTRNFIKSLVDSGEHTRDSAIELAEKFLGAKFDASVKEEEEE